jgi:hypothetical protein
MIETVIESETDIPGYVWAVHRLEEEMLERQTFKPFRLRI